MEQWAILALVVVAGLMLVSILKSALGAFFRYLFFVGMAAAVDKWSVGYDGFEPLTRLDKLQDIAVIGGIGFAATTILIIAFFRETKLRMFLYPLFGFAAVFAVYSVWPEIEAMWT